MPLLFTSSGELGACRGAEGYWLEQTVWITGRVGRVDGVFQSRVAGFRACGIHLRAIGIGQHAPAVGEVQNVSVLKHRVDQESADANLAGQPLTQVAHVDFDSVHHAIGRATAHFPGFHIADFAFAGVIEIDGIPVELGWARPTGRCAVAIPSLIGRQESQGPS